MLQHALISPRVEFFSDNEQAINCYEIKDCYQFVALRIYV